MPDRVSVQLAPEVLPAADLGAGTQAVTAAAAQMHTALTMAAFAASTLRRPGRPQRDLLRLRQRTARPGSRHSQLRVPPVTASAAGRPPGCPPWCSGDHQPGSRMHQSASERVREIPGHPRGWAVARVCRYDPGRGSGLPATAVEVMILDAASDGTDAYLEYGNLGEARQFAMPLDFMATATEEQHRALARQVRRAADLIDGEEG